MARQQHVLLAGKQCTASLLHTHTESVEEEDELPFAQPITEYCGLTAQGGMRGYCSGKNNTVTVDTEQEALW